MTVVRLSLKRRVRPLPLSCAFHGVILLALGLFMSFHPEWQAEPPVAEVEMEVSPDELPERHVPQAGSLNPFAENSVWKPPAQSPANSDPVNQPSGGSDDGMVAPSTETPAANGDGVPVGSTGESGTGSGTLGTAGKAAGKTSTGSGDSAPVAGDSGAGSGPSETLASIASRFAARVEGNKEYPYMAVKRGQTGVVRVTVTISADGDLASAYVSGSAGSSLLDNAAMQAVQQSCPFSHGAGKSITLTVPIHFDLQG
ncbi:protein TonB [Selenomonas sp. WCT3]|uniref:TonB family protein n=1 Tax=Selenomonas sp. WCT3 TaxID=3158785 RepID=UPI00088675B5|nr:protein TonB [Selenomonas ruminantium]